MRLRATVVLVGALIFTGCAHATGLPLRPSEDRRIVIDDVRFRAPLVLMLDASGAFLPQVRAPVTHQAPDLSIDQLLLILRTRASSARQVDSIPPRISEPQG